MRAWLSHRPSLPSSPNKARKSGEQSRQHGIDPQMGERGGWEGPESTGWTPCLSAGIAQ